MISIGIVGDPGSIVSVVRSTDIYWPDPHGSAICKTNIIPDNYGPVGNDMGWTNTGTYPISIGRT